MKVSELIKALERLSGDEDPEVAVAVGSYYKSGKFSYNKINRLNRYTGHEIRLEISLGEEFVVRAKGGSA